MGDSRKPPLVVIVGPTAAGKSELAVRLAKQFNGEIISADSRQIYRGLDIGTGKVSGKWVISRLAKFILSNVEGLARRINTVRAKSTSRHRSRQGNTCGEPRRTIVRAKSRTSPSVFVHKGIPHHCIDFVSPKRAFGVAGYQQRASSAIRDIVDRGKIPILVGGTGFWIDAVVFNLKLPPVPPNQRLRKKLSRESSTELFALLERLDPERSEDIEKKNPRRLIRAIEIAMAIGRTPKVKRRKPYRLLWIGLAPPGEKLKTAMQRRIDAMLRPVTKSTATTVGITARDRHPHSGPRRGSRKEGNFVTGLREGLIGETKKLTERVSKKRIREFGFQYRAGLEYLEGKISPSDLRTRLIGYSFGYAKRQMRWFKRNPKIHWVKTPAGAERLARRFLTHSGPEGR